MRAYHLLILMLLPLSSWAQEAYTDVLQRSRSGQGTVVIYQDEELRRLVNNLTTAKPKAQAGNTATTKPAANAVTAADATTSQPAEPIVQSRAKVKSTGYRIQVYAGGNSRNDRQTAQRYASAVRSEFPELNVYTNFVSPRWVCRAGDFRTHEEAAEYLGKFRSSGNFGQSSIVKSTIMVDAY